MPRALAPLLAAALGLAGCLAVTLFLHHAATAAVDRALDERLRGAGQAAARLLPDGPASPERLRALRDANALDGAFLLDRNLTLRADASGAVGGRADLLRVDPARVEAAFSGQPSISLGYRLGELPVRTGYFPVPGPDGGVSGVLALEAGEAFAGESGRTLSRALWLGLLVSFLSALALAVAAARYVQAERRHRDAVARAARGEAMARMAAIAAHEIRNPLGVIRGTVELMRDRVAETLGPRELEDLSDVLGEVERLKRLTQDFLDLSSDKPLTHSDVDLELLLLEAGHAAEMGFPGLEVRMEHEGPLPSVRGDAGRLRQVLANLLTNAAQARPEGPVWLSAQAGEGRVRIRVRDEGPGVAPELRDRLFEPFVTGKETGTGLGLAVSRQIAQRHGGSLSLVPSDKGAIFELTLPVAPSPADAPAGPPAGQASG